MKVILVSLALAAALTGCADDNRSNTPTVQQPAFTMSIAGVDFNPDDVAIAKIDFDNMGRPTVQITLSRSGVDKFQQAQSVGGIGKPMPIVINGKEISAPILTERVTGRYFQIGGNFTVDDANRLANMLSASE